MDLKYFLFILFFISFFCQSHTFHNGRIHYKSTYACESNQLDLRCEDNEVIHLVRANYGRFSISICNEGGIVDLATNCMSFKSFLIMQDRCHQKSNCSVVVSSKLFGDPCPGTLKYLEVQYRCAQKSISQQAITSKKPLLKLSSNEEAKTEVEDATSSEDTVLSHFKTEESTDNLNKESVPDFVNSKSANKSSKTLLKVQPTLITNVDQLYTVVSPNSDSDSFLNVGHHSNQTTLDLNSTLVPTVYIGNHISTLSSSVNNQNFEFNLNNSLVTQATNSISSSEFGNGQCNQRFFRSLRWPAISFDRKYSQKCPGDAIGQAHWRCSSVTKSWYPDRPDFTDCKSSWLSILKQQLQQYTTSGADSALEVLKELATQTLSNQLFADDLREIDSIVTEALMRVFLRMDTRFALTNLNSFNSQDNVLKQLLENLVEVVSNLLANAQDDAWIDLENSLQTRQIAFKLLTSLQESALVLAKTLNQDGSFSVKSQHVLVTVHVLDAELPINLVFPVLEDTRDSAWAKMDDSIFVAAKSLLDYANNGFTKVAFFSYNRMEDLLKPNASLNSNEALQPSINRASGSVHQFNHWQPSSVLNSRILSTVFVVNNEDTSKFVQTGKNFPLSQPIVITFKHINPIAMSNEHSSPNELHGSARCVYWNIFSNDWMSDGCWLATTNSTHSICMCNQAGQFALQVQAVSSNNQMNIGNISFNGMYPIFNLMPENTSKDFLVYSTSQLITKISCVVALTILFFILVVLLTINGDNSELLTINRHLCFCMLSTQIILLLGVYANTQFTLCSIVSSLLHFFLLAILLWCFLATFDLYLGLIDVYDTIKCSNRLIWYYVLTYGGSFIVLIISLIINHNTDFDNIHTSISYGHCWLSIFNYLCFTFIGPAVGVVLCSLVFLVISIFIVSNNFKNLQLINRAGIGSSNPSMLSATNKYSSNTINSSLPVVNIMSGSMIKCGYAQTGLSSQTYVNTKEQLRFDDVRKGVRLTLALIVAQCLTWTSGLLHVNSQQSPMLSLLFSVCNFSLSIFVLIYCTARTDSMEHHKFVPHLQLYKWFRSRFSYDHSLPVNNSSAANAASLNQINQLNSAMSSLTTTGSSCLINSKSACNLGNYNSNVTNALNSAPLATAATLIGQQTQPVVTQVATQVSGILNGNLNIMPNSPTIQMGMNHLTNQASVISPQSSISFGQFKNTSNQALSQSKQQQIYSNNYGFSSTGNIYHQPVYQQNMYQQLTNVNNLSNVDHSVLSARPVATSMQATVSNLGTLSSNLSNTITARLNSSQASGNRVEINCQYQQPTYQQQSQSQQQQHQQQQQQQQQQYQQISTNNALQLQQREKFNPTIAGNINATTNQQQPQGQSQSQQQQATFNNTRSPIYYTPR